MMALFMAEKGAKISASGQTCGQNEKTDIFGMSLSRILEGFKSNKKPQKARKIKKNRRFG